MKQFRSVVALAACALALTACGEEAGDEGKGNASGASLDGVKGVVTTYVGAVFSGDAAACDLETEQYATAQNEASGVKDCTERIEAIKMMLGEGESLFDSKEMTVDVSADGDAALAAVSQGTEGAGGTYRLVQVDGAWLVDSDDLSDEAGASGDDSGTASRAEPRAVSEAEAKEMSRAFCAVKVGTSREDVEEILGEPSSEGIDDDGQTEVDWFYNQDSYSVWFDETGAVASFSSSTPREEDSCEA